MALTQCGECGGQVSTMAEKCPHCGAPINPAAQAPPPQVIVQQVPQKPAQASLGGCLSVFIFGALIYWMFSGDRRSESGSPASSGTASPAPARGPALKLISHSCEINAIGMAIAKGQVQNVSGRTLDFVKAVAGFYDGAGKHVDSDSSFIEIRPLLPGQKSGFSVYGPKNPAVKKCAIEAFQEGTGGQIEFTN